LRHGNIPWRASIPKRSWVRNQRTVNGAMKIAGRGAMVGRMTAREAQLASRSTETRRTVVTRLRERVRYGLLTQEVLACLTKAGLLFYPYFLVDESPAGGEPKQVSVPGGITFSELKRDQAAVIADLPCRPRRVAEVEGLMQRARCFGVFDGDALVGYSWVSFSTISTPKSGDMLFELSEHGAYLFDMYIARSHRGRRLAPWLRLRLLESLLALGYDEIYSLSLSLNRSTRLFKARVGAAEIEHRLALGVKRVFGVDLRLRSLVKGPLPTPRCLRLRGWVRGS